MESRPWANLPQEIISRLASKSSGAAGVYVFIGRVCKEWWQCLTMHSPEPPFPSPKLPFLLVPPKLIDNHLPGKVFPLFTIPKLIDDWSPFANSMNSVCIGSSHGWLITLGKDSSVSLLNPVTADSIPLKPLSTINSELLSFDPNSRPEYHVKTKQKARTWYSQFDIVQLSILSSDPAEGNDFTLLLFLRGWENCCFTLNGRDGAWTAHFHQRTEVQDVIFIRGVFFTFSPPWTFGIFDFRNVEAGLSGRLYKFNLNVRYGKIFLVNSNNIPLIVYTCPLDNQRPEVVPRGYIRGMFRVCQFDPDSPNLMIQQTMELNGMVLFVGSGCSVAVSLDDFPWLTENAIYYTLSRRVEREEERITNMWQEAIYRYVIRYGYSDDSNKVFIVDQYTWYFPRQFWVTPNLRRIVFM